MVFKSWNCWSVGFSGRFHRPSFQACGQVSCCFFGMQCRCWKTVLRIPGRRRFFCISSIVGGAHCRAALSLLLLRLLLLVLHAVWNEHERFATSWTRYRDPSQASLYSRLRSMHPGFGRDCAVALKLNYDHFNRDVLSCTRRTRTLLSAFRCRVFCRWELFHPSPVYRKSTGNGKVPPGTVAGHGMAQPGHPNFFFVFREYRSH